MIKILKRVLVIASLILTSSMLLGSEFDQYEYKNVVVGDRIIQINTVKVNALPDSIIEKLLDKPKFNHNLFKDKMGVLESSNNYNAINIYGYLGKYQFSRKTLRGLVRNGYLEASKKELRNFRNAPDLQERAMNALIEHNSEILLKGYKLGRYIGKDVLGVRITMEGLLAAAHLLGPYSIKHFITTGGSLESVTVGGVVVNKYDGNGTSIITYLKHFQHA